MSLYSAEEYYDLLGIPKLFRADGRLTLLGESITDSFIVASHSGESYHYCFTLQGATVSGSYSSAEPTLVPWWTE